MKSAYTYAWPPEAVALLRKLALTPLSSTKIANEINAAFPGAGLTRSSVIGKCHRIGVKLLGSATRNDERKHLGKKRAIAPKTPPRMSGPPREPRFTPPPPDEPGPTAIPFLNRKPLHCAWIFGDANADSLCCGKRVIHSDYQFCPDHRARVVTKGTVVRKGGFIEVRRKGRAA